MEPILIYQSRGKMLRLAIVTFLFSLGNLYLSQPRESPEFHLNIFHFMSAVCAIISLYPFIQYLKINEVIIRLDEDGFHQLGTSIPWSGIVSFRKYEAVTPKNNITKIGLDLTETARVLCGLPSHTYSPLSQRPGDIEVFHGVVDLSIDDLLSLLEKYRIYYTQSTITPLSELRQQPLEEVVRVGNSGPRN